jgi:hypothetical protein
MWPFRKKTNPIDSAVADLSRALDEAIESISEPVETRPHPRYPVTYDGHFIGYAWKKDPDVTWRLLSLHAMGRA